MNTNKKFFSKIGFNYLILAILALVFQIIAANIIAIYDINLLNDTNNLTIISSVCNYILPIPVLLYLMNKIESTDIRKEKAGIRKFLIYVCVTMTLMWIGNILGLIITALIGGITQNTIINPVEQLIENSGIYLNLLIISFMAPIFEEFFFRKLLIDRTIKYGAKISIILSALLFALFHGNLNQFFYAFLMGGFFAYVYIKTGKITYTIALHMIVNFIGSVISLVFTASLENIIQNSAVNPFDLGIVAIYAIFILSAVLVGIIALILNYRKARFNGKKTEIPLKNPYRTIFLNPGMILFVGFFIIEIIQSLGLI